MGAKIVPPAAGGWRGGPATAGLIRKNINNIYLFTLSASLYQIHLIIYAWQLISIAYTTRYRYLNTNMKDGSQFT